MDGRFSRAGVLRTVRGMLLAVVAVAAAFALRMALKPAIGVGSPFIIFTPAVMVAAFYGGVTSGVVATALSAVVGSHFFLRVIGEPGVERWDRVALFVLVGSLLTTMTAVVRRARERLDASLAREQRARAEAEAANRAKDEFLALISHELQTPASVMLGWASAIRSGRVTGETLDRALETIERNARVQSKLVADVLDTSRIVSGRLRFEPERLNLTAAVRSAIDQIRPAIQEHKLALEFQAVDADWPVRADPVRLQQVFTNILANAVKFTPAGGRIMVRLERDGGTSATVTVADTGIGIDPAFMPRIFDRFEQDPHALAHSRRGLGLGLALCRYFVEQQGGRIAAHSDGPGRGATFTVTLPLDSTGVSASPGGPSPAAPAPPSSAPQGSGAPHEVETLHA